LFETVTVPLEFTVAVPKVPFGPFTVRVIVVLEPAVLLPDELSVGDPVVGLGAIPPSMAVAPELALIGCILLEPVALRIGDAVEDAGIEQGGTLHVNSECAGADVLPSRFGVAPPLAALATAPPFNMG
jgi:hypothetical protein